VTIVKKIAEQTAINTQQPDIFLISGQDETTSTESVFYQYNESMATNSVDSRALPVAVSDPNQIYATAYIAANVETGKIYAQKNAKEVLPVASMSKLVTAFAATDMLPRTTTISITENDTNVPPDSSGIAQNETYTLNELLYPLLLNSSNVAAEAMASKTNRVTFLELMSSYAWEIGMSTAFFADPSGVDPHNAASADDLLALAKYLYKYRPDILELTRTSTYIVATTTDHGSHIFASIHPFVNDPDFIGGKTGRTPEAGDTMLTIMRIYGQPVAIVVLGSKYDGRYSDTKKIIELVKGEI